MPEELPFFNRQSWSIPLGSWISCSGQDPHLNSLSSGLQKRGKFPKEVTRVSTTTQFVMWSTAAPVIGSVTSSSWGPSDWVVAPVGFRLRG